jgi:hypothetical protein
MSNDIISCQLKVTQEGDPDVEELALLADQLRNDLALLDVDRVDHAPRLSSQPGTKAAVGDLADTLIVTMANSAVLVALMGVVRSWVSRGKGRRVTVRIGEDSIEVSAVSNESQKRLIDAWIDNITSRP